MPASLGVRPSEWQRALVFLQALQVSQNCRSLPPMQKPANIERAMFQLTAAVILNFYNSSVTSSSSSCISILRPLYKVQIFWEGHKNLKKISHFVLTLLSYFKKRWEFFSNFVAFSQYPNFNVENLYLIILPLYEYDNYGNHSCQKYEASKDSNWNHATWKKIVIWEKK